MPRQAVVVFRVYDYEYSDTAVKKGVDNTAPPEMLNNILALHHNIIVPILKNFSVVWISSGYRSPLLNAAVGSSNNASQHTKGQACDLVTDNLESLFNFVFAALPFDQLIYESYGGRRWIHVSYTAGRRRAMAMRTDDGKNFVPQAAFA